MRVAHDVSCLRMSVTYCVYTPIADDRPEHTCP